MELTSGNIRFELQDHIAIITMDRPEKLNALSMAMAADLRTAFTEVEENDDVRAMVLTGNGMGFSTGEDVHDMRAHAEHRAALAASTARIKDVPLPTGASPLPRFFKRTVHKPSVAAVNGVCAGMGYGMALASDIRVGSTNARFSHVYNRRGSVTSAETWYLPRIIGLGAATYHILMATDMDSEEALRLGLLSKLVQPEQLMPTAMEIAGKLAAGPAAATRFTKQAIFKGMFCDIEEAMEFVGAARRLAASSGEGTEGSKSYLEKRPPNFIP